MVRELWEKLGVHYKINQIINSGTSEWLEHTANLDLTISRTLQWKEAFPFYLWNIWLTRISESSQNQMQKLLALIPS